MSNVQRLTLKVKTSKWTKAGSVTLDIGLWTLSFSTTAPATAYRLLAEWAG